MMGEQVVDDHPVVPVALWLAIPLPPRHVVRGPTVVVVSRTTEVSLLLGLGITIVAVVATAMVVVAPNLELLKSLGGYFLPEVWPAVVLRVLRSVDTA